MRVQGSALCEIQGEPICFESSTISGLCNNEVCRMSKVHFHVVVVVYVTQVKCWRSKQSSMLFLVATQLGLIVMVRLVVERTSSYGSGNNALRELLG